MNACKREVYLSLWSGYNVQYSTSIRALDLRLNVLDAGYNRSEGSHAFSFLHDFYQATLRTALLRTASHYNGNHPQDAARPFSA
jgi:hypothetical protein